MSRLSPGATAGWLAFPTLALLLCGSAAARAAVVHEQTVTGASTASATVATSSRVTAASESLYVAAISTRTGSVSARSVSGLGLAWTLLQAQCAGRNQTRVEVWKAIGTATGDGVVTATLSAAASSAVIAVSRYSGVDRMSPIGIVASANTRGVNGACSGGVDSASYSVNLTTTAANAVVYGAAALRNRSHTPGTSYTERAEVVKGSGGNQVGLAVEDRPVTAAGTVTVHGTLSGKTDWAVVAFEIRSSDGTANHPPVAQDQSVSTAQESPRLVRLAASDADGDPLTYRVTTAPAHGDLTGTPPDVTYTPHDGFTGQDAFSFVANDTTTDGNVGTVSITVTPATTGLDAQVAHALDFAGAQLDETVRSIGTRQYPFSTSDGSWNLEDAGSWGSGFFPGALWWMFERTADPFWRTAAESWTWGLESQKDNTGTHDVGFIVYNSFGRGHGLTADESYRPVILTAAGSLATRYSPVVGCTRSWNGSNFVVIIDNMMNLELLFWAARNGGDAAYYDMALSHALKTREHHVRTDGSTYHVVEYNPSTGAVVRKRTAQGYADDSTWSRGQAWAVYGFTMSYRETGDPRLLETAQRTADYFLAHLPADHVPLWDFNVPSSDSRQNRDSSAAAVAASGLLELSQYAPQAEDRDRYRQGAEDILLSLTSSAYLAEGTSSPAVLLHGARNVPSDGDVDSGLIWGDYYFVEAMRRYQALVEPLPAMSFASTASSIAEANVTAELAVRLAAKSPLPVTVDYLATAGTATTGTDYAPLSGTLIFDPGEVAKPIPVGVIDDGEVEGNETIEVSLVYASGAVLGAFSAHVLTIVDNAVPGTPPAAPAGLSATAGNLQVSVTWNAAAGASSYSVQRSTTSGSGYSTIQVGVTGTSHTDANVANGTTYYYVVTAVNAAGESEPSNEAGATPVQAGSGNIVLEEVKAGGSSSSMTVATSGVLAGAANNLYLAAIATKSGSLSVTSVNGLGLTWTLVRSQCAGRSQTRMEVWKAIGTPAGSGVVTATLSAAPANAVIEVARYSGVNVPTPVGNVVSANTSGVGAACSGGADGAAYSVSLTAAADSVVFGAVAMRNRTHTPGNGYTERAELMQGSSGDAAGAAVLDRKVSTSGAVTVSGMFSATVDWAVVVVEIRP